VANNDLTVSPPASEGRASNSIPFWHSRGLVASLALLAAAIAPTTAMVTALVNRSRDLELAQQEHEHKVKMDYLGKAVDPAIEEAYKHSVLRLLATDQLHLKKWATGELERSKEQCDKLATTQSNLKGVTAELAALKERIRKLKLTPEAETAAKLAELDTLRAKQQSESATHQCGGCLLLPTSMQATCYANCLVPPHVDFSRLRNTPGTGSILGRASADGAGVLAGTGTGTKATVSRSTGGATDPAIEIK
jgi:hypothetical protein